MHPFDQYPQGGRVLLGSPRLGDGTCRRSYGLDLQRRTGQMSCAYCGVSLVDDYYHWLLMAMDHVVPVSECRRLGIPDRFAQDCINLVLACSGCNGFKNQYRASRQPQADWSPEGFLALRDEAFRQRSAAIAERRASEQQFFQGRPWVVQSPGSHGTRRGSTHRREQDRPCTG